MAGKRLRRLMPGGVTLALLASLAVWLLAPSLPQPPAVAAPPSQPRGVAGVAKGPPPKPEAPAVAVDLFRVDATGNGIVAGQATPGATVDVRLDGASVATGIAGADGSFVGLFTTPVDDTPRVLSLATPHSGDARFRGPDQTFIIQPRGASTRPETAPGGVAETASHAFDATAPARHAAGEETDARFIPENPEVPTILRQDASGLAVVQSRGGSPAAMDRLSIDTITYGDSGAVSLGGRSGASRAVRVYVDNRPVEAVTAAPDGQWRAALPPLDSRVYTLRVDTLGPGGRVLARAETPFRPEEPSALARMSRDAEGNEVALVTVQPGFTLWRIADENYGDGFSFVRVFEANADKIRDPDLIYPGQIFTVPD